MVSPFYPLIYSSRSQLLGALLALLLFGVLNSALIPFDIFSPCFL